jgi:hypothetical protein
METVGNSKTAKSPICPNIPLACKMLSERYICVTMDTVTTEIIVTSNTAESPIKKFHKNLSNNLDNTNMY